MTTRGPFFFRLEGATKAVTRLHFFSYWFKFEAPSIVFPETNRPRRRVQWQTLSLR